MYELALNTIQSVNRPQTNQFSFIYSVNFYFILFALQIVQLTYNLYVYITLTKIT